MQVSHVAPHSHRQWSLRAGAQTPTPEMERFQQMPLEAATAFETSMRADPLTVSAPSPMELDHRALFGAPSVSGGPVHNSSGSLCSVRAHRKSFRRKLADFFRRKRRKSNTLDEESDGDFEEYGSHPPRRISAPMLCHVSSATSPSPVLQALPVVFYETPVPIGSTPNAPVFPYVGYRSNYLLAESLSNRPRALVRPQRQDSSMNGGTPSPLVNGMPRLGEDDVREVANHESQPINMMGSLPDEELNKCHKGATKEEASSLWEPCDDTYEQQLSSSAYVFSLKRRRQVPRTNASTVYSFRPDITGDIGRQLKRSTAPTFKIPSPPSSPPPDDLPKQPSPFSVDKCVSVESPDLSPLITPTPSDDESGNAIPTSPLPPLPPGTRMTTHAGPISLIKKGENPMVGEVANIVEEVNRMTEELLSALMQGSRLES